MTRKEINTLLYRELLDGKAYDGLLPKSKGTTHHLNTGNTEVAILEMAKWAKQYAHQTQDLAPVLIGGDLKITLDNIHRFLYWHIQYSIDGFDQNLKSPARAWETRKKGTDCKSYSIFASTILLNLGVKHYLRRIKQAESSDSFTHVYVVIPANQKTGILPNNAKFNKDYYIIDGTINPNEEIFFLEKDDLYMEPKLPIYGLAASLGCGIDASCGCVDNSQSLGFNALSVPVNAPENVALQIAIDNFFAWLDHLEASGMPKEVVDNAIYNLQYYVSIGVEPTIADLLNVRVQGLSIVLTTTTIVSAAAYAIKNLIPKDFFSKTFGSVFANGFNLSCWNSTFTPAKTTEEAQTYLVPYFNNMLARANESQSTSELEFNLNELLKAIDISYVMFAEYLVNGANWRKCSKEAIEIYVGIVKGAKTQSEMLLKKIQETYNLTITTKTVPAEFKYSKEITGAFQDFSWSEKQHGNATYRIVKFKDTIEDLLNKDGFIDIEPQELEEVKDTLLSMFPQAVSALKDINSGEYVMYGANGEEIGREDIQAVKTGNTGTTGNTGSTGNTGNGNSQNIGDKNGNMQTAGFSGAVPILLIGGLAYGTYVLTKKKK